MFYQIFVSPSGTGGEGTKEHPIAYGALVGQIHTVLDKHGFIDGIECVFRGGTYFGTMELDQSVTVPVSFKAYPGETPVFVGGQPLVMREGEYRGMRAWFADLPEVFLGKRADCANILLVNGERRSKTRLPESGTYRMESVPGIDFSAGPVNAFTEMDTFVCADGDIQDWYDLQNVEVVVLHYWREERLPIAHFDPATRMVITAKKSGMALNDDFTPQYSRYYVENVKEALSKPGQWYLDKKSGELIYLPLENEALENTTVMLPSLESGVVANGVQNISFEGLSWNGFDRKALPCASTGQSANGVEKAVIELTDCRNVAIRNCTITNAENYGISVKSGCRNILVDRCEIAHMGAGGVRINGAHQYVDRRMEHDTEKPTGWVNVTNCHIHDVGLAFPSAACVLIMNASHNVVSHNELHDGGYSGISLGWSWGYSDSVNANNLVEYNHIYDLGKGQLSDFGGIYTLGNQSGTVLRGNVIHDLRRAVYGGWGIYPDEGTYGMLVEGNLVYRTQGSCFYQHYGRENIVRNNVFACSGGEGCVYLARKEDHNAFTSSNNILISDGMMPYYIGGADVCAPNYRSDANLFWSANGTVPGWFAVNIVIGAQGVEVKQALTQEQWAQVGQDRHSLVADPGFADIANGDWSNANTDVLEQIGFKLPAWDQAGIVN